MEVVLVSSSGFLLAVAVGWLVIGEALSLVPGRRGHSRAHLVGSAAGELARTSRIPVLVVGDGKTST
jgi:nucleotide-binding universal stress UspA family protein